MAFDETRDSNSHTSIYASPLNLERGWRTDTRSAFGRNEEERTQMGGQCASQEISTCFNAHRRAGSMVASARASFESLESSLSMPLDVGPVAYPWHASVSTMAASDNLLRELRHSASLPTLTSGLGGTAREQAHSAIARVPVSLDEHPRSELEVDGRMRAVGSLEEAFADFFDFDSMHSTVEGSESTLPPPYYSIYRESL